MSADELLIPASKPCSTRTGSVMAANAAEENSRIIAASTALKHFLMLGLTRQSKNKFILSMKSR
jgi:hypothetical protein